MAEKKKSQAKKQYRRGFDTLPISNIITRILREKLSKMDFRQMDIMANWQEIMPDNLAVSSKLSQLKFPPPRKNATPDSKPDNGHAFIKIEGNLALEARFHYNNILERLNRYFGYDAVDKISFIQVSSLNPKEDAVQNIHDLLLSLE